MGGNLGDLTGQTFGTCTLISPLGQGGMGAVYLAKQTRPSRNVAVKILHPSREVDDELYHEFLARFEREADVIARLEHINIMPIYEYGEQNHIPYLVMPHLKGGSFRELLAKNGTLSLNDATTYIEQAAAALNYAHARGVIHRDLKPANFLLHADGRLVLADFGIARIIDTGDSAVMALTHTGTIVGTPDYMAPEMAQGDPIDYRADIYELGIVLYQMLTGHVPFTGSSPLDIAIQHIQKNLPLVHPSHPHIPPEVDEVLQKATAKRPADRFATATAMAQALRKATQQAPDQSQALVNQEQTVRTNLPTSTTIHPPASHQAMQQQPHPPVAPPIMANQGPIKLSENAYLPGEQVNSISTLAQQRPQPAQYQSTPQKSTTTKGKGRLVALITTLLILIGGGGILTATLLHTSTQQHTNATTGTPAAQSATANAGTPPPHGPLLYSTTMPAPSPCNETDDNNWKIARGGYNCGSKLVHIQGPTVGTKLGSMLLEQLPGGQTYPNDYVVQAHVTSVGQSAIGIYFRSQPGNFQIGTYAFLVSPDGTWQANVYDNTAGNPTQLTSGTLTGISTGTGVTLAVAVKGANFSFYINNQLVGTTQDSTYSSGIVGIAVDHDGEVIADQFSLSTN